MLGARFKIRQISNSTTTGDGDRFDADAPLKVVAAVMAPPLLRRRCSRYNLHNRSGSRYPGV